MQAYLAIPALLAIAALFSEAPGQIAWRVVFGGVLPQIAIALLFLKIPPPIFIPHGLNEAVAFGFRPLVWLIRAPWSESATAAGLMARRLCSTNSSPFWISRICAGTMMSASSAGLIAG